MRKSLRYLRFAFAAFCGVACMLLIVLWLRSFDAATTYYGRVNPTHAVELISQRGFSGRALFDPSITPDSYRARWGLKTVKLMLAEPQWDFGIRSNPIAIYSSWCLGGLSCYVAVIRSSDDQVAIQPSHDANRYDRDRRVLGGIAIYGR